ncbi:MAG: glutamate-cysteine ligase family protein, partial [Acidobacteriota bacterium]|nr:glutamate-cysteine ligase family protein [Acidobacteriota bacterium]
GVELEYMIVDRATLNTRPIADELLKTVSGQYDTEVDRGAMSWSNELALHVVELKTTQPVHTLRGLAHLFQEQVLDILGRLAPLEAVLLPTAMHPWMDPHRELRLWPHEHDEIYRTFDRIFGCSGHGWANLQSMHLNLPFADDEEFGRLHAAVRLILPILPALAASSPVADGRLTGLLDTRLEVYRHNADRVPSVAGRVVPEAIFTRDDYERTLLGRIYEDLASLDPEGVLRHEWVNGRGCIARFDRMALEIRVLDVQECPSADLAVATAVVGAVRALVEERWATSTEQRAWADATLANMFLDAVRDGDEAIVGDAAYAAALGFPGSGPCRMGELWQWLIEATVGVEDVAEHRTWVEVFGAQGCLARRMRHALGPAPSRDRIAGVYRHLAQSLERGVLFEPRDV